MWRRYFFQPQPLPTNRHERGWCVIASEARVGLLSDALHVILWPRWTSFQKRGSVSEAGGWRFNDCEYNNWHETTGSVGRNGDWKRNSGSGLYSRLIMSVNAVSSVFNFLFGALKHLPGNQPDLVCYCYPIVWFSMWESLQQLHNELKHVKTCVCVWMYKKNWSYCGEVTAEGLLVASGFTLGLISTQHTNASCFVFYFWKNLLILE